MRKRASGTSQFVTMARALAHGGFTEVSGFSDPTALPMLPPAWRFLTRMFLRRVASRPEARARTFERSDGKWDLMALRTRVLDEAWHAAQREGMRQLVLLGAGLDGRAFRLDDLAGVAVFEVDHPATQALKRRRTRGMSPRSAEHRYVPVDFERDDLDEALRAAGHLADARSFWIWEGVTTYLTAQAQETTLEAVTRRSSPGSRIAMTYVEPGVREPARPTTLLRLLGEPWVGLMTRQQAAERLSRAGLRVVEDSGEPEWRDRFCPGPKRHGIVGERIAVAER